MQVGEAISGQDVEIYEQMDNKCHNWRNMVNLDHSDLEK